MPAPARRSTASWLRPGEVFGQLLDGQEHLAFHHPRARLDGRVGELVLHRQGGGVEAVAADQPGVLPAGRSSNDHTQAWLLDRTTIARPGSSRSTRIV
jgi:hypothetical protein